MDDYYNENLEYFYHENGYPGGMAGQMGAEILDYMTWDLIVKNTPKLMLLEIIIHRN